MKTSNKPSDFSQEIIFTAREFTAQLCCSPESKKVAYHLRHEAYANNQSIKPNAEELFSDKYDLHPNSRTQLIWHNNTPVATVRSSVWSLNYQWTSTEALDSFWHAVHRHIGLEHTIIESNRFALIPGLGSSLSLQVQLLLFRIQDLNCLYEKSAHIITVVRKKHVSFYERMLQFRQISDEKFYPWVNENLVLLAADATASRATITKKGMQKVSPKEVEHFANLINTKAQSDDEN
jgi:hypothetical protein